MNAAFHTHTVNQRPLTAKTHTAAEAVNTGARNRLALHTVHTYCILVRKGTDYTKCSQFSISNRFLKGNTY